MKVLVISHMYPSNFNEINGIFVHKSVQELKKNGCEIVVVSPVPLSIFPLNKLSKKWNKYSLIPKKIIMDDIEVYYPRYVTFPKGILFDKSGYFMYKGIHGLVNKLNNKHKFDLIHSHVALPDGFASMIINKKLKLPHVVTIHGQDLQVTLNRGKKYKDNIFRVFRNVDKILLVSEKLRKVIINEDFICKATVIHNGIDMKQCEYKGESLIQKPKNSILILSVCNLYKSKGTHLNIESIAKLKDKFPNIIYWIIGDGPEKENLKKLVASLGVDNQVRFLGKLENNQVMGYLEICDIFSLPSWKEGFGIAYLEAMYHGKPSIGVKGEGIEDAIKHKENGMLVLPSDAEDLREQIEFLIENKDEAVKIGNKGKTTVEENFSWKNSADKVKNVYEQMMKKTS
ncbi:glycosyltransferase [Clostridium grantii]|uniref:Uncharacterized protein n=1 Tax=Clostridium grantii DSM 8605 TaxID=1121316 RepID=A0A1M5SMT7_9CLOT|nr:glycosyltransferase [Clostridium grantii]SHH39578.1 hypothetical protein SAMN02745207_01014 [Clostridium grantii DSM 8605]